MKFGAAWFGFRKQTYANYFEMSSALGLNYVEIPLYWQIIEDDYARYSLTGVEKIRALAEQSGVYLVSSVSSLDIAGSFDMKGDPIDKGTVEFAKTAARRAIDIGSQLGVDVMRITEPNVPEERLGEAQSYMEEYGREMRALGDYAADKSLKIVVENYGLTSEQVNWLLDAADHPAVGTLYDPCNYMRIGEDPLSALKNLGERVYYCHLKDTFKEDPRNPNLLFPGSRWAPSVAVGKGEIDWGSIMVELATFYDGYLCFEYEIAEDVMRGTRASIEYIRQISNKHNLRFDI